MFLHVTYNFYLDEQQRKPIASEGSKLSKMHTSNISCTICVETRFVIQIIYFILEGVWIKIE